MQVNRALKTKTLWRSPLAARLTKRAGCLAGRAAVVLGAGLALAVSALAILEVASDPGGPYAISGWSTLLAIIVWPSLPIFIAYVAASLTVNYARSFEYPLVCTTTLSDAEIVKGYLFATLYYCRSIVALMMGLVPMVTYLLLEPGFPSFAHRGSRLMAGLDLLILVLKCAHVGTLLGVGLLGISLMAAALGMWLATWWRSVVPAASVALMLTVGVVGITGFYLHEALSDLGIPEGYPGLALGFGLFMPVPWVLAAGSMRLARRWARRDVTRGYA